MFRPRIGALTTLVGRTPTPASTTTATTVTAATAAPIPLTFEQVDGTWVIADESACAVLSMGRLSCT